MGHNRQPQSGMHGCRGEPMGATNCTELLIPESHSGPLSASLMVLRIIS